MYSKSSLKLIIVAVMAPLFLLQLDFGHLNGPSLFFSLFSRVGNFSTSSFHGRLHLEKERAYFFFFLGLDNHSSNFYNRLNSYPASLFSPELKGSIQWNSGWEFFTFSCFHHVQQKMPINSPLCGSRRVSSTLFHGKMNPDELVTH